MTTPQDTPPLQGAGERDQDEAMAKWFRVEDTEREADNRRAGHFHAYYYGFDLTGEDAIDLVLRQVCRAGKAFHSTQEWNETYGYDGESSEADQIQEAARRAAESLRAQRQAWEEERAELKEEAAHWKRRADNNDRLRWARLPEEHPDGGETWAQRAEEHAAALASLREENARLTETIERNRRREAGKLEPNPDGSTPVGDAYAELEAENERLKLDNAGLYQESIKEIARLRARVEELEGVLEFYAADYNWTEEPDGGEPPTGAHDPGSPPDGYLEPKALRDAGSQARAALSSLGERESGEGEQ